MFKSNASLSKEATAATTAATAATANAKDNDLASQQNASSMHHDAPRCAVEESAGR